MTIWKFTLRPWSIFMDLPRGAEVLSAGAQGSHVVVWAKCDPRARKEPRMLAAFPTGEELPRVCDHARFVGTAQLDGGLVFHVFEAEAVERDGVVQVAEAA